MSVLVSLTALKTFLTVAISADDAVLQAILDGVERLFLERGGRARRPFAPAQNARGEVLDGTGSTQLVLDYPIAGVSGTITLGLDPANPDETLDPADPAVVVYTPGDRTLHRVDGRVWGPLARPRYVRVTYDAQADLPESPALAIKRVAAAVYRQLGSEDARAERTGTYSRDLATVAESDPIWTLAVDAHREHRV